MPSKRWLGNNTDGGGGGCEADKKHSAKASVREACSVLSRNPTKRAPTGSTNSPSTIIHKNPKVESKQKTPTHEWINTPV